MGKTRRVRWLGQTDYDNDHFKTVSTRVPTATAKAFEAECKKAGKTKYAVLQEAIAEFLVDATSELFRAVYGSDSD